MKRKLLLLTFPLLFSWFTLPYEFIKGAHPYQITVKASSEEFERIAKITLEKFNYIIEQPYKTCLIGRSKTMDSHVYMEWFIEKNNITHVSIWRIRYKMNPVSFDAKVNNEYEKLSPDKEIFEIGKEVKIACTNKNK